MTQLLTLILIPTCNAIPINCKSKYTYTDVYVDQIIHLLDTQRILTNSKSHISTQNSPLSNDHQRKYRQIVTTDVPPGAENMHVMKLLPTADPFDFRASFKIKNPRCMYRHTQKSILLVMKVN